MGRYKLIISGLFVFISINIARAQLEAWDQDQDAMPNGWEYHRELDVDDPRDAWLDPDQDGICNLYEYLLGSDPQDPTQPRFVNYTPELSLAETIRNAGRGMVLRIPMGHYDLNYQHESLADPPRLMLQGGWNADFTEQDHCRYPTVLDGKGQGAIFDFLIAAGTSSALIIDGFTLQGGSSGALRYTAYLSKAQLLLANCRLIDNSAHRSAAIVSFEDSETTLISDLIVVNTIIAGNYGTGLSIDQAATHTNFKVLHSLIGFNEFSKNDHAPYTSGQALEIRPATEDTFHIQLTNTIFWANAGQDIQYQPGPVLVLDHDIQHNIYDFLEFPVQTALFDNPTNRSIDPLLNYFADHRLTISPNSPAIGAGKAIGLFSGAITDIGPVFCEPVPTASAFPPNQAFSAALSPNPAKMELFLKAYLPAAGHLRTTLYSASGRLMLNRDHGNFPAGEIRLKIPVTGLVKGIYILEVRSGSGRSVSRFVRL